MFQLLLNDNTHHTSQYDFQVCMIVSSRLQVELMIEYNMIVLMKQSVHIPIVVYLDRISIGS